MHKIMDVYIGPHLIIKHDPANNRLIISWKSNPTSDVVYRKELIEHRKIVEKIKPSQVMWLLENLTFKVDDATKNWVSENISNPIFKAGFVAKNKDGFDQIAFVVGKDVLAYIEVMDIFKASSNSGFKPKYFATEAEARNWLNEEFYLKNTRLEDQNLTITFKGTDNDGKVIFEFKEQASKFGRTIQSFKAILEQNHFIRNNVGKYSCLTPREKEVLQFIINGDTNKQISEKMYVSHHTIRTHRNRIWKKLDIQNLRDCLKYECFFN